MNSDGFNPMRWDCSKQGCFNKLKRPKIEIFAECLPGRIAFTDVDAVVEIGGNLLELEWKCHREIAEGQAIKFRRATRTCHLTVIIVEGDAETMAVDAIAVVSAGIIGPWCETDIEGLKRKIAEWALWASANYAPDLESYINVKRFPASCTIEASGGTTWT